MSRKKVDAVNRQLRLSKDMDTWLVNRAKNESKTRGTVITAQDIARECIAKAKAEYESIHGMS